MGIVEDTIDFYLTPESEREGRDRMPMMEQQRGMRRVKSQS